MALDLASTINEINIHDQRDPAGPSRLYARDAAPAEQLAFARESLESKSGRLVGNIRRARLKWGCLVVERAQAAATPDAAGYGFMREGAWMPLSAELSADQVPVKAAQVQAEYAALHGPEWATWIAKLPPWKAFLLARVPLHLETVAQVIFEGAGAVRGEAEEPEDEEAGSPS